MTLLNSNEWKIVKKKLQFFVKQTLHIYIYIYKNCSEDLGKQMQQLLLDLI